MSQRSDLFERAAHPKSGSQVGSAPPQRGHTALKAIACASTMLGLVLIGVAGNPEVLSTLSTAHLLGAVILALGPALTMLAISLDRRLSAQVVVNTDRASTEPELRIAKHEAHDRAKRAHTRVEETQENTRSHEHAA